MLRLLLFFFCICTTPAFSRAFRTVIIDPGHGGYDKGGLHGKVYEKHLALDTALRLKHYLSSRGIRCRLTRDSDYFVSLAGRVSYANRFSNAIFVSIHYNHSYKKNPHGLETFYASREGRALAQEVQRRICSKINTPNRGIKQRGFYVLRHAQHPAILVECGFVSNSRERDKMKKAWFRQSIAEGIGEGILRYRRQ